MTFRHQMPSHEVRNDTAGYPVVLFVDFARPLDQPFRWLNERFINLGALAPFSSESVGEAGRGRFGSKGKASDSQSRGGKIRV
jgi:hypothetical protein